MPHKMLTSWNADKQQGYRDKHPDNALIWHILLDESPSMSGENATNLRTAFSMYLAWLQRHADPMSLAEVRCFSTELAPSALKPLGMLQPLTAQTYDPIRGSGTALYRAVGETCAMAGRPGRHVLIVFTDGYDNASERFEWTSSRVHTLLTTLQAQSGWLCIFLGAFPGALEVGKRMGFVAGNCLTFATDQLPAAFETLRQATQQYLTAGPQERKLLAAGGIF
jgi:hypothetical protein